MNWKEVIPPFDSNCVEGGSGFYMGIVEVTTPIDLIFLHVDIPNTGGVVSNI